MFSVTQYGKALDNSKYSWDEKNKIFNTDENDLVLDFSDYDGVTFRTGNCCTLTTGFDCIFSTGNDCVFKTGAGCKFKTGDYCIFKTSDSCVFRTGHNCFVSRYDVLGVTCLPMNKTIKLNEYTISGHTEVKDDILGWHFFGHLHI